MGLFGGILQGLGGILGSIVGGIDNSKAVKNASKAQQAGIQQAIAEQQRQFDLTRSDFAPYLKAGTGAIGGLGDLTGLNGSTQQQSAINGVQASPFYQSLYRNGLEANLQNASATGGIRGGNEVRGLADFGSDTLMQAIQQQLGSLGGIAGLGEGATNSVANFGAHAADNISSGDTSIGNSQYNSILGQQQVWNNMGSQIAALISKAASAAGGGF